ncbi:LacI family DNA-binding transcriptional regulator [Herbiconiux flava]|uniref:DNA-binding LacI/PurR family transcriptional regulator n=1 Tax=Herbiconiux flava TaxID=881268 RepID=A0A852SMV3_9MICO|nr:LacI family DNA-binding transcriptional regulator [Herbiconiux flava]NYD70134.1 DNA-binding LacI/PurR family transcriptional regulator [Herbiconiux flava]
MQTPEPTLADVAARAGVSVATASRALTGARPVSDTLHRKVRDASRELGYRRNAVASALRLQRTETVGLVLPRYTTGFLSALIESVSDGLERNDLSLVLRYSEPDALHDVGNVESLMARRVDGIIICPSSLEASQESIEAAGPVPIVQVGRFVITDRSDSVGLDEDRATAMLVAHLVERAARRMLVVGLDPDAPADARRIRALRGAAEGAAVVDVAPFTPAVLDGGIRAAERVVAAGPAALPDAIVCANDDVAAGVLAVLRMRGLAVPARVQVASLLDLSPGREDLTVTTLRHPWPEMGREAVRLLLDSQQRGRGPGAEPAAERIARRVSLAPQLVPGQSTREHPVPDAASPGAVSSATVPTATVPHPKEIP